MNEANGSGGCGGFENNRSQRQKKLCEITGK
jgi:hypothetical protein